MRGTEKKIERIVPGSIAEELGIEPGDLLVSINDRPVGDILDYHFLSQNSELVVLTRKADGEEWEFTIEKDEDEDLGLEFSEGLLDEYRHCSNKCIFCFIDQLPKGLRRTLYFKDDDTRLSFIQGNYVTLTNVSDADLKRVIEYRLSPINVSVHTTDEDLRKRMLGSRFAGDIMRKMKMLADAGISLNAQIVLCRGINDGEQLDRTLNDLSSLSPQMESAAVVPVGLTRYREGLYPLEALTKEDAAAALLQIGRVQERMLETKGTRFVYASDELILLAGAELPSEEEYEGYPQLENGVGMLRLLIEEVRFYLEEAVPSDPERTVSIATGMLAKPFIEELALAVSRKYKGLTIKVYGIRNKFFGSSITVSGLVTGQDIISELKGEDLGERLLIPVNMLRIGEKVFLDDVTTDDLERELNTEVFVTDNDGYSFVTAITGDVKPPINDRRQLYEQTDSSNRRET